MGDRILVTGATGKVGRELVRLLLGRGETVRAATRSPAAARMAFGSDVEVVEMDYESTPTYDAAVEWVDRLFLMPPPFDPHAFETIRPFLDWAITAGVGKVVLLSAMDVENLPQLALHKLERHLATIGTAHVILRPNLFMQNFSAGFLLDGIRRRGLIELCAGEGRVSFVDGRDVAAVASIALCDGRYDGMAFTLTGVESLDLHATAAVLSNAAARQIQYVPVEETRVREILTAQHWPARQTEVAVELFRAVREGRREALHPDAREILGRAPTSLAAFATENAHVWR
jgi:uncharacterized protein YbjT (DUF2867 family)